MVLPLGPQARFSAPLSPLVPSFDGAAADRPERLRVNGHCRTFIPLRLCGAIVEIAQTVVSSIRMPDRV